MKRVLSELLAEHWGEMISQTNSATVSSRYTQLFQVNNPFIHKDGENHDQGRRYFCKMLTEAEPKEKHGVWDPMQEMTITLPFVHSNTESTPTNLPWALGKP